MSRAVDVPGGGENDRADLPVLADLFETVQELAHERERKSVSPGGSIQRHDGDGPVRLEAEVLVHEITYLKGEGAEMIQMQGLA